MKGLKAVAKHEIGPIYSRGLVKGYVKDWKLEAGVAASSCNFTAAGCVNGARRQARRPLGSRPQYPDLNLSSVIGYVMSKHFTMRKVLVGIIALWPPKKV